ncbi:PREDICTED: SH3 domain-binding protein 5 isoform X4 [Ficedula albicollis]|uniref:SH3 domain-binding protein 5 isoform X4 n=1 Tax=Ficedula albicollis TaxID=59894 RepID=UPI000359DF8E|nr:PREDICTED: SH3 domain-binding protein 5 isoform X4 [Ficedula albicollis]
MESGARRGRPAEEPPRPEDEEVDPRIQGELEKLNQSTDDINRRETELEDARQKFRSVLVEATVKLDELVKKIGKAVEDSKPYWEARRVARQAQLEAQRATQDFQRATEVLRAAKETISLAEQRLLEDDKRQFDSAWQEMLNHATQRVMEAEQTKTRSELVHKETAAKYNAAMGRMKQLEKKLKRAINKSKPYFELKAKYYVQLEQLKKTVDDLQAKLALAKGEYKTALKNLEMISDEIHERRRSTAMGPRGCGVGAEGSNTSVEDLSASKAESDTVSMASEVFEDDNGSSFVSEEDSETQSVSSFSSGPTSPCEVPTQFPPATRPGSLDLPSPVSLSEFGMIFPVLGPRSECSGASSPECEAERVPTGNPNFPHLGARINFVHCLVYVLIGLSSQLGKTIDLELCEGLELTLPFLFYHPAARVAERSWCSPGLGSLRPCCCLCCFMAIIIRNFPAKEGCPAGSVKDL